MKKITLLSLFLVLLVWSATAQINVWQSANESELQQRSDEERWNNPTAFGLYKMDVRLLRAELSSVPHELQLSPRNSYAEFQFPLPDGQLRTYRVVEYEMMEPELARKFSHMKTYIGIDIENGSKIRFNLTKGQFFATINEKGSTYYIDPYFRNDGAYYVSYNIKNQEQREGTFECGTHELIDGEILDTEEILDELEGNEVFRGERGDPLSLFTYRLAVSGTFEFTNYYGGTVEGALDGITTIVNRINSVLEREAAIRLILVNDNDKIIFTTEMEDPFEDGNLSQMINQNQITCDQQIGSSNYDMGHVFGRAFYQGLAQLGAVCGGGRKARGGSVSNPPIGDAFTINIICHEMGHQFNAPHTMYHCHNVNIPTAYEPGSGSTIMSYAGICSGQANIQQNADDYYHANSLERILGYSRSGGGEGCATKVDFGNSYPDPILDYPNRLYIPVNTAFRLRGTAEDVENSSTLTYNWDQYQPGFRDYGDTPWNINQPEGNEPIFRSVPPSDDPMRYFPALPRIVNDVDYLFEQLPTYARDLRFRFLVRDNASENGGTAWAIQNLEVIDNSAEGQFEITNFNTRDTIQSGDYVELTWNVAGTTEPPLRTEFIDVYLSTDGGLSFPLLIKSNAKNDGSTFVNLPNVQADRFRIMIEASNSVYIDVSDRSGVIEASEKPSVGFAYDDQYYQICAPDVTEFEISTFELGGFDGEVHFEFVGDLPAGARATFSAPNITVGQSTRLKLDTRDASEFGEYDLRFQVTGDGIDTMYRTIETKVVTNDFSDLTLDFPVDGSVGVDFVPSLVWSPSDDAADYTVEVAEDPNFNNIVFIREHILVTQLDLDLQLDAGKVYFWRVQPRNECGRQDVNRISSFQIKDLSCEEFCSTEPSKTLSSTGTPTVSMSVTTPVSITANDLNVTQILGRHSDMGQVVFTLEGPQGIQVEMYSAGTCVFFNTDIDMGFDDDAALAFPNCVDNVDDGLRFIPTNPLSAFNGINGNTYTLIMDDVMSGAGGVLDSWCFEICGDIAAVPPVLVRADSIHLFNLESRVVSSDKLEITHPNYSAAEITITIVDQPLYGQLLYEGNAIGTGATLTMQDIIDNKLVYQNQSMLYDRDHFSVIAQDPGNGYLGTPTIDFVIGLTATHQPLPAGHTIALYPNPAHDVLNVELKSDAYLMEDVVIYSLQGKQVMAYTDLNSSKLPISLNNYTAGIYLMYIKSGDFVEVRKFIKQ